MICRWPLFEASPLEGVSLTSALCQIRLVGEISLARFLDSCEGTTTGNTTNFQQLQPHTVNDSQFTE